MSNSTIGSQQANAVHVMHMVDAFTGLGCKCTLFTVARASQESSATAKLYGTKNRFRIRSISKRRNCSHRFMTRLTRLGLVRPKERTPSYRYERNLKRTIAVRRRPDVIYGRNAHALSLCLKKGAPVVYEAHRPPATPEEHQLQETLFSSDSFCLLVVISNALKNEYVRLFRSLEAERVLVAPDAAPSSSLACVGEAYARSSNASGSLPAVGYVGSLLPGKGGELVLQIAELLPDVQFHVVGGTDRQIEELRSKHQAHNVTFHGHIAHGELQPYYNSFEIALAPYQKRVTVGYSIGAQDIARWMSPLKLFEYMAQKKAIVASDLPVLREVLSHDVNAVLVPAEKAECWANALTRLLDDDYYRERIASAAYQDCINHYTWDARASRILSMVTKHCG